MDAAPLEAEPVLDLVEFGGWSRDVDVAVAKRQAQPRWVTMYSEICPGQAKAGISHSRFSSRTDDASFEPELADLEPCLMDVRGGEEAQEEAQL